MKLLIFFLLLSNSLFMSTSVFTQSSNELFLLPQRGSNNLIAKREVNKIPEITRIEGSNLHVCQVAGSLFRLPPVAAIVTSVIKYDTISINSVSFKTKFDYQNVLIDSLQNELAKLKTLNIIVSDLRTAVTKRGAYYSVKNKVFFAFVWDLYKIWIDKNPGYKTFNWNGFN